MRLSPLFASALMALAGSVTAAPPFPTALADYQTVKTERQFDATIEAVNQATISAQTSGQIVEVNFDVDDFVPKDSVIIRFRDKEQQAAATAAEARYIESRSNFERIKDLYQKKLVSKSDFDKGEAGFKAAKAEYERAQEQLEHTIVRAPYSGIVVKRHVEPGEVANPGQPLMTGISLELLRATANVSQRYIDDIRNGGSARVLLPRRDVTSQPESVEVADITISPFADAVSHTFKVRVDLPEGRHDGVYPGMFAKVAFTVDESERLLVPKEAVVLRSEVTAVYVIDEQGKVSFRQIRAGQTLDGGVEVLAGLSAGERVALEPIRAGVLLKQQRAGGEQ